MGGAARTTLPVFLPASSSLKFALDTAHAFIMFIETSSHPHDLGLIRRGHIWRLLCAKAFAWTEIEPTGPGA